MIPYGRQNVSDEDIQAVVEVLRSDFLTQGPVVPKFERALCDYTGAKHAVASNSATSSLHLACLALGLGPDDTVWTTPITFVATANCALYCGAEVDFVDIDPNTFNLCAIALKEKLEQAKERGKLPKIVIPVHLCGLASEMEEIARLANEYGFSVIEDASHAIGGSYKDEHIGNCRFSDITVFSFHPIKIITTGEGGLALTNDSQLAEKMALLCSHGVTRNPDLMSHESHGAWYYQQIELGYNYRMTDIQAALGLSQMARLDKFVARRHEISALYDKALADLPVTPQHRPGDSYSGMHLYVVRVDAARVKNSHRQIFSKLREAGIGVNLHYIPVHLQPWYRKLGFRPGDFPEAERYYDEAITLPMYPDLTHEQFEQVVSALKRVFA